MYVLQRLDPFNWWIELQQTVCVYITDLIINKWFTTINKAPITKK